MYYLILFILAVSGNPVLSSIIGDKSEFCREQELSCGNSSCVHLEALCDGSADGFSGFNSSHLTEGTALNRSKRLVSCNVFVWTRANSPTRVCSSQLYWTFGKWREWECHDGTCIPSESKCDGQIDCSDKSDESHAVCRNMQCQDNFFRCTYGACVEGTAPCNGNQDCADNSDELLPSCRNETAPLRGRNFVCGNGEMIPAESRCDGVEDCDDRSDEILATCAATICPAYYFQCAYGACVDYGSDCDGKKDCADGSDEDDVLCNKTLPSNHNVIVSKPDNQSNKDSQRTNIINNQNSKGCILPSYPEHGSYAGIGVSTSPGDIFDNVRINFTCSDGYRIIGDDNIMTCFNGEWLKKEFPECIRFCKLKRKAGVEYKCVLSGNITGVRNCDDYEPVGTRVKHTCQFNYRPDDTIFGDMYCKKDGSWGNVARCLPDCGKVTDEGIQMIINGQIAEKGELPWHAGIYLKEIREVKNVKKLHYKQICGGSLISKTTVISAAHCFWENGQLQPAEDYAVALGKLYRNWDMYEDGAQKSEVKKLYVPIEYMGNENLYQADIAMVVLSTAIEYKRFIKPVCLNIHSDRAVGKYPGNIGKVAGWGPIAANSSFGSKKLRVVDLPFVDLLTCRKNSKDNFKAFISADKFCAGYQNGTTLCPGDSGGGLVFLETNERYYLKGVVSTGQQSKLEHCDPTSYITFTKVVNYADFIMEHWHSDE